jgi:hypothetical protein
MSKLSTFYHKSYDGGLNDTASPREIARDEASKLQDWCIAQQGRLFRRYGLTQVGSTLSNPARGLHAFLRSTGGKDLLVMDGTSLKYLNGSSFSALDSGFTSGNYFALETVPSLDRVYISNEDNTTHYWDRAATTLNSCLTDLGNTKFQANVLKWHKNHLFFLNNLKVGSTLYANDIGWSDFADPDTHDTTNSRISIPGGGRVITAADLGNAFVIFKERSIFYLTGWGDTDWTITATSSNVAGISEAIGCIAPRGVTRVGNELWFVDDEGQIRRIFQTDFDAYRSDHISTKIQATLATVNKTHLAKALAWTSGDHVYFAFPQGSGTENSLVIAFDILASKRNGGEEAWEVITGWTPGLFADYLPSATPVLYISNNASGKVYSHTGDDDDGVAINADYTSKDDDYDRPERWKRYKFGYVQASSASNNVEVDIYTSVDLAPFGKAGVLELESSGSTLGPTGNATMGPTGSFILGGGGRAEEKFYYTAGGGSPRGKTVRHSLRHSVINQQPTVDNWTSHYKERQLR